MEQKNQLGLGMFDVAVILCGGLIGRLADTRNKRLSIFLGLILFAVSSSLIGFYLNAWFLVFGFVASVGDELSSVSLWSWMNQLNRDHAHDGLVASVIGLFQDVGWAVGPVLAGCVYSRIGPSWTIMVGAGFVCVSWLVSSVVLQRGIRSIFHSPLLPSTRPHRYSHKD
jgi:MFS family permease